MAKILEWLQTYSAPMVWLIAFGAALIYILKEVVKKSVTNMMDRYIKEFVLRLKS